ncbi:hypothetical protein DPMN_079404 [Dreissena polymorpha]|uniref:Uncharacterized protein n=1 Tax=Dreissena polymorpha TaxID=45954 RepID=A0A9D3YS60_DREPO|nr:hypothetical protein DPMN_079404 [Dreissena polymorpha]
MHILFSNSVCYSKNGQDVDGSSTSAAPLLPLFRTQSRIEVYTNPQSGKDHPDL